MASEYFKRLKVLYRKYKRKGKEIYALLDPLGLLAKVTAREAVVIARDLVDALLKENRDTLSTLIEVAIELRKQCLPYFKGSSKRGHKTYIWFLKKVQQYLAIVCGNDVKETGVDIEEHEPVVDLEEELQPVANVKEEMQPVVDVEQELQRTDQQPSEEAERSDGEESGHADDLTLEQLDFLSFLEVLMAMIQKAAAFWKQAADKELPASVAASLSTISLCEADQFINLTRLLDEEDRKDEETQKGPTPWAATDSKDKKMSYPMLAKDLVDALDQAKDAGEAWRKLAALPPKYISYLSFIRPSMEAVPEVFHSRRMPYVFAMLLRGQGAFRSRYHDHGDFDQMEADPMSSADLPLTTLLGLYFLSLVVLTEDLVIDSGLLHDARNTVCAEMDGCLHMLPRMIRDKGITYEQAGIFRAEVASMKLWANACREPMSLGDIHVFSRTHWADWYGKSIASNSNLLQTFLYLYEKRRLEAAVVKGATGPSGVGDDDVDDDERLLGALLEDSRVAPQLLMDGRPRTVQQCVMALQDWCHVSTMDGETLSRLPGTIAGQKKETERRQKAVERSCQVRKTSLLCREILDKRHDGLHIDTRARLREWGDGADDDSALARYLIWETAVPDCLQLEEALRTTLRKLPAWTDMCVKNVLVELYADGKSKRKHQVILNHCKRGIRAVFNKKDTVVTFGTIDVFLLEPALVRVALGFPGCDESLRSALADGMQGAVGWEDSWNDELLQEIKPGWKTMSKDFEIKRLFKKHDVQMRSYIMCLMPMDDSDELDKGRRPKKKKDRELLRQERSRQRNEAVGEIFKDFMNEARPVFEEAYRKETCSEKAITSSGDIVCEV